jgi:hypothetical protein
MPRIHKYPRTHHLEGSRLQPGDEDLSSVPLRALEGRHIVVEEKVDGGNAGISFDDGRLYLQSRGHFLDGGSRERHFALFKTWANRWTSELFAALGHRYVLYGEWLYAKHTVFYDALPHYFLEFDVLDTATGAFLSTPARRALLDGLPIVSVPILWEGRADRSTDLGALVTRSLFKSAHWGDRLVRVCREEGLREDRVVAETDRSDLAEGLYVKVEDDGRVLERYKFIRPSFLQAVLESESHWLDRPILPNQLAPGVDLFGERTERE